MNENQKDLLIGLLKARQAKESEPARMILPLLFTSIMFGLIAYGFWSIYQFRMNGIPMSESVRNALFVGLLTGVLWIIMRRIYRTSDEMRWVMHTLLAPSPQKTAEQNEAEGTAKWPWGNYENKDLQDMAAVASVYWSRYDPADEHSAPTIAMVENWLMSERHTSKEKAKYIARILRADDLKPGRKSGSVRSEATAISSPP